MKKSQDIIKAGPTRQEDIKVEPNVHLHITDAGKGRPVVLIHYATANCLMALRDTDLRKDLIPMLIMHGKKDKICSFNLAEQMKAGISDAELIPFENSGHRMFLEETAKVNAALVKFAEK
jgi:pimeloyl-ACP methyl ester carboxylesterase